MRLLNSMGTYKQTDNLGLERRHACRNRSFNLILKQELSRAHRYLGRACTTRCGAPQPLEPSEKFRWSHANPFEGPKRLEKLTCIVLAIFDPFCPPPPSPPGYTSTAEGRASWGPNQTWTSLCQSTRPRYAGGWQSWSLRRAERLT